MMWHQVEIDQIQITSLPDFETVLILVRTLQFHSVELLMECLPIRHVNGTHVLYVKICANIEILFFYFKDKNVLLYVHAYMQITS